MFRRNADRVVPDPVPHGTEAGTDPQLTAMRTTFTRMGSAPRRQAEEALRDSEERFRRIAGMNGEWICEQGPEGRYIFSNAAVKCILASPTATDTKTAMRSSPNRVASLLFDHTEALIKWLVGRSGRHRAQA